MPRPDERSRRRGHARALGIADQHAQRRRAPRRGTLLVKRNLDNWRSAAVRQRSAVEVVEALVGRSVAAEGPNGVSEERAELGRAAAAEVVDGVGQRGTDPV